MQSKKEIKIILIEHKEWLQNSLKGKRANLSSADLRSANLSFADLRCADLSSADLSYANLRFTNLSYANLSYADLRCVDLSYADLSYADLRSADLSFANLSSVDLSYANLSYADLSYANLSFANLSYANLSYADLRCAKTDDVFVAISCIGSRKDSTIFNVTKDIIWCGCYTGNLQDFEKRVEETHKDNLQFLKEYRGAITYFKTFIITEEKVK